MEETNTFKIYLVDNEIFCLNYYEMLINSIGYYEVSKFLTAADCLDHLHENPDVIFLDINMKKTQGLEILKTIKGINPNIHVVMLSGQQDLNTAVDCMTYGAFDYLIKGDKEEEKIENVLFRIGELNSMVKKSKTSLLKRLFF